MPMQGVDGAQRKRNLRPAPRPSHWLALSLTLALVMLFALLSAGSLLGPGVEARETSSATPGTPFTLIFLPLMVKSYPLPTPTSTPTTTPTRTPIPTTTPTPTPCPVDDVTGIYDVQSSNVRHNCPFTIEDPPIGEVQVIQDGSTLIWRVPDGDVTGTINPVTGAFRIVVWSTEAPCFFGCLGVTTGTFHLGQNPMTVDGTGRIEVRDEYGGNLCTATYDIDGTRVSC